jgi:hypothetical protein
MKLPTFLIYKSIQTKNLKETFTGKMIKDVEGRHALGASAGYETHPDISPYDKLMLKMMEDISLIKEKIKR